MASKSSRNTIHIPSSLIKNLSLYPHVSCQGAEEFQHRDLIGVTQGPRGHHAILSTATGQGEEVDGHLMAVTTTAGWPGIQPEAQPAPTKNNVQRG